MAGFRATALEFISNELRRDLALSGKSVTLDLPSSSFGADQKHVDFDLKTITKSSRGMEFVFF